MNRLFTLQVILAPLLLIFGSNLSAQDGYSIVTRDLETWSRLGIEYKFNKNWRVELDQGLRLKQNSSTVDQIFTQFSIKWKPVKQLTFVIGGRYIKDQGGNGLFDNDFRFQTDASYKHKVKRLILKYRLRFQTKNEIGLSIDDGDYNKNYLRFKFKLNYNIKNWQLDPYFSTAVFRDLTRYTGSFDTWRFTVGTAYNFKKFGELETFYRMERELGPTYPKTTNIIGLNYQFSFKKLNKND